jgi:hypothetical protein
VFIFVATLLPLLCSRTFAQATCGGDCDSSGDVTVNELIIMVNVALGTADLSGCQVGDADGNGTIEINEIIAAVNNALGGCADEESVSGGAFDSGTGTDGSGQGGTCPRDTTPRPDVGWISQRLMGSWSGNLCCGPAVATMTFGAFEGMSPAEQDLTQTIDWMSSNIPDWLSHSYKCSLTNEDILKTTIEHYIGGNRVTVLRKLEWCVLLEYVANPNNVVIFEGCPQGNNATEVFRDCVGQGTHWLILRGITGNTKVTVHDPGRTSAADGKDRSYTASSVQHVYDRLEGLALIADIGTCMPSCVLKCGGASDGCPGGSCTAPCPDGYSCSGTSCVVQTCAPNSTRTCYDGSPVTNGVGVCRSGTQTCDAQGSAWGPCIGEVQPQSESCNGLDDDCNGIVDDPGSCWQAIYRYKNAQGARCLSTSASSPPSTCAGYTPETEAFSVRTNFVAGTFLARQCSKSTDHIVVPDGSLDQSTLVSDGYNCDVTLGYIYNLGQAPSRTRWTNTCNLWRYRDTISGSGAHLFTRGADDVSLLMCEPPARGQVFTNFPCFSGTAPGC